jgi:AcrR family transcriptional regulator
MHGTGLIRLPIACFRHALERLRRQINKANRQKQVVANAARFFSSIGYDLTSIDMVAKRSNMSPATIYNNFENKIGLLLAVLIEEGEEVQRIGEQLITERKQADVIIIYRLIELYVDHPMEFMNKSCWRQALAASTASSNKKFTREYQNVDKRLKHQLIDLMHALQKEHTFVAQVDPASLGAIIWNNVDQMFTDFISNEGMSLNELKSTINRQTSSLVNLALNLK